MAAVPDPTDNVDGQYPIAHRVDAAIDEAGLRGLPTLAGIIDRVATIHGKPICLEQVGDDEWGTLTGLWVETREMSRIFTRRTDPVAYQFVCALHEAVHILLGHPSCFPTDSIDDETRTGVQRPRTPGGPLGQSGQQVTYEAEAEYGARVLAQSLLRGGENPVELRFG
jgi:hypothetical protein